MHGIFVDCVTDTGGSKKTNLFMSCFEILDQLQQVISISVLESVTIFKQCMNWEHRVKNVRSV